MKLAPRYSIFVAARATSRVCLVSIIVWGIRDNDFSRMAADVVLHNMPDGVIMLDAQKQLVSYNKAAADIFTELHLTRLHL